MIEDVITALEEGRQFMERYFPDECAKRHPPKLMFESTPGHAELRLTVFIDETQASLASLIACVTPEMLGQFDPHRPHTP